MAEIWKVPPMWKGQTVVSIGGGPSLTKEQVDYTRGKARVIAINDAYLFAPWADIHYFCDPRWWEWHKGRPEFAAIESLQVTLDARVSEKNPSIKYVMNEGAEKGRLCLKPGHVFNGRNSGYQVINLAVQLGVSRIVLLGYDMREVNGKTHWFGNHPSPTKSKLFRDTFLPHYKDLPKQLSELGVEVMNSTPDSALTVFPMVRLEEALQ